MLLGGGVAGAEPPHKGGPNRPDRPKLQLSVASGQWSEAALSLLEFGRETGCGQVASRGIRKYDPILGCACGGFPIWILYSTYI